MILVTYKSKSIMQYKGAEICPQHDKDTASAQWVCVLNPVILKEKKSVRRKTFCWKHFSFL